MIKEYKIDENTKREIEKTQYKKHPKWKKRAGIIKAIDIISIVMPIIIMIIWFMEFIDNSWDFMVWLKYFFIAIGVWSIFLIFKLTYIKILRFTCDDLVNFKINETLIVTDNYFENSYKPNGEGWVESTRDIMRVKYNEVDRLLLNKYHNRLRVWATIKDTRYLNYEKKEIDYSYYEKGSLTFYLYYEDSDEFVKTLVEKSGVELEVIDCPEV